MKKKIVAVMMCAAMVAMLGVGCGSKSSDDSSSKSETKKTLTEDDIKGSMKGVKLKVGTSGLFGPFSYYDEDGKTLIGYDLDLISDLQDLLGFEIDGGVQAMDYSALTTSLSESKLDMGAAALCATDERKEVMNFTDVYCDSGQVVMVNQTNDEGIKSVDDLKGKKVAVEKGTASHTYASKNLSDSELEVHDTITTAYESLEQKKVDAVIQDGPGANFYIKTTLSWQFLFVSDCTFDHEYYRILLSLPNTSSMAARFLSISVCTYRFKVIVGFECPMSSLSVLTSQPDCRHVVANVWRSI